MYRTPEEDAKLGGHGMHPAWRSVDVRIAHWREARALALVAYINARWQYDPSRPGKVVAYVDPHGTGPHIHFQTHALTRRKPA